MEKPSLPKGTRDFGPAVMAKRQFIIDTIKTVFQKYGFQQLETPAMENLSTLTGKYGEEGDQLLFKVLESGDFTKNAIDSIVEAKFQVLTQELYDEINFRLGPEKERSNNELRRIIKLSINTFDYRVRNVEPIFLLVFKEICLADINLISSSINEWFRKSNRSTANDVRDRFIEFLKIRNDQITEILESFIKAKNLLPIVTEKGLKYDLTVPFARYVVMNRNDITFPFKRFQIQPVWRADRPQKGRYREFYQCDADVIGTDSLLCEAEIVLMIREAFKELGIQDFIIKINHRGILSALAEISNSEGSESSLFVAIDKLDKIGEDKVKEELKSKGFSDGSIDTIFEILTFKGSNLEKLDFLASKLGDTEKGKKGIEDLKTVIELLSKFDLAADSFELDIALARGLSYYTGAIFEVKINKAAIGSVSGGGRYDDLTGVFGAKDKLSGVGISFGLDRLYDAMEELKLFPPETEVTFELMIAHMDQETMMFGLGALKELRRDGIYAEIYPDHVKLKKQLDYANKKNIPFVIVIGSEEMKSGKLTFKNMRTGEQQQLTLDEIIIQF